MTPAELASLDRAIVCTITHQPRSGFSQSRTVSASSSPPALERHSTRLSPGVPTPSTGLSSSKSVLSPSPFLNRRRLSEMPAALKKPHASARGSRSATPHGRHARRHHHEKIEKESATTTKSSPHTTSRGIERVTGGHHSQLAHHQQSEEEHSSRTHSTPLSQACSHHGRRRRRDSDCRVDDEDGHGSSLPDARHPRTETSPVLVAVTSNPFHVLASLPKFSSEVFKSLLPPSSVATCILALDAKLIELLYCLSPTSEERQTKLRVIDDVRTTMQQSGMDIEIYGSLYTGLTIPASDVDCVLMRSGNEQIASAMREDLLCAMSSIASAATGLASRKRARGSLSVALRTVADRMRRSQKFTHITWIGHARVPIVKCRHRRDDVKVDMSFEKGGCVSSNYLCNLFCKPGNEMARPLIVLVKALVNNCGLDDPSIGGLGSFPISLLVLWYLQHCVRSRFSVELQRSIGALLTGFLKYYGTEFDFRHLGIDYVQQKTFTKPPADDLYIVNPIHPATNCAKASTLFATRVVPLFQQASATFLGLLDAKAPPTKMESLLLHYFAKAALNVSSWREVSRRAAREPHLQQNMWDAETNMYVGGVI